MTTLKPEIIISKLVIMSLKLIITTQTQTRNNDLKNSYLQTRNYDFQIHNRDFKLVIMSLQTCYYDKQTEDLWLL